MSTQTKIEWTEQTWNPTVGCSKVSPGCTNCYAESLAKRLRAMRVPGYENGFEVTLLPHRLSEPMKRKKPTMYFVNSMSDVFHEEIPFSYIDQIFETITSCPQHTFQILTKRSERMALYFADKTPPPNAWIGVTVENKEHGFQRIEDLRTVRSKVRMLSIEPLLERLDGINLTGINWVIVGGESGPGARPVRKEWITELQQICELSGIPFFFKQWGMWGADGIRRAKKLNGRALNGNIWDEKPIML